MRALRLLEAALLTAALAGCSAPGAETRSGYEALAPDVGGGRSPMAELPEAAGQVIGIVQRDDQGVVSQRIALRGDPGVTGENAITVKVNDYQGPWDIDGPVGIPTRAMIASELDAEFPTVDMAISQVFTRNSFGPFGYALGHPSSGVTCIYAWEFGVWQRAKLGEAPTGTPSMPLRPTSVRVRLCRSTLGEAEMLSLLHGLQVFPANSRIAYFDPSYSGAEGASDALGAAGVGGFVTSKSARMAHGRASGRKVAHHAHHHRHYAAAAEGRAAAIERPLPGAVAVPMPGGGAPAAAAAVAAPLNPLLAPLAGATAVSRPAASDDLPLPSRAPAEKATPASAPARSATIPLPD